MQFAGRAACCIVAEDVTRRKRQANKALAAQRMEGLGRLAAGLAHDFNNLLAVIVSYSDFIAEDIERAARGPDGEVWLSIQEDIGEIQSAAGRANRITEGLLAFATRAAANPQVFDPNGLIEDLHPVLRRTVGDHVAVRLELGAAVRRVNLDPGQLEQVLLNLVVNAGEAMPDGGALVIETTDVELDDDDAARHGPIDPGAYVGLRVRDSGVGLGADTLARAFEPFFTTKPAGDGAGLGLATVYGLVTGAGGTVWIESERSDGTTVTALFPAAAETASVDVPTGT